MINMGYTFTNSTSQSETFPIYCTVVDCGELIAEITLLPHATVTVPEAICGAPRIAQRHAKSEESEHG